MATSSTKDQHISPIIPRFALLVGFHGNLCCLLLLLWIPFSQRCITKHANWKTMQISWLRKLWIIKAFVWAFNFKSENLSKIWMRNFIALNLFSSFLRWSWRMKLTKKRENYQLKSNGILVFSLFLDFPPLSAASSSLFQKGDVMGGESAKKGKNDIDVDNMTTMCARSLFQFSHPYTLPSKEEKHFCIIIFLITFGVSWGNSVSSLPR